MTTPRLRRSFLPALACAACAAAALTSSALGQLSKVLGKLNEPWSRITDAKKAWKPVLTAALDLTEPPSPIGVEFDFGAIWPGMTPPQGEWKAWAAWAEKNAALGKVLIANQDQVAFAMPYGEDGLDAAMKSKGFSTVINLEADGKKVTFGYLRGVTTINTWCVTEMYRLCEAEKYDEAFALGIANVKLLRQLADQQMLEEKLYALDGICTVTSVHRQILFTYRDKLPGPLLQRLGTKDYPLIRPADGERLRRLEMPEGDRYVAEAILASCFDDRGQPSPALFAEVFAGMQSMDAPLTRFGAARRWTAIAAVHGSLDASTIKLVDVYDDWWRRWRFRPYDSANSAPTELSTLNPIRYAAISLSVLDIDQAFLARRRAAAYLAGVSTSFALASYRRANGAYPDDIEKIFPIHGQKRLNYDPYDKSGGSLIYRFLGSSTRTIDTVDGPVTFDGALLYARGEDNEDSGAKSHDGTGLSNDIVMWPPLRAVARIKK